MLGEVVGEILGHALGERGHEHALVHPDPLVDLGEQIVHLDGGRAHLHRRIHEPRRAHHLLHDLTGVRLLVGPRGGRDEDTLGRDALELVEAQRPVVERTREPETVLDQRLLARAIAAVHAAELGDGDVALVDDQQRVVRQVVEQGRRRLARRASREMARVVLDALAVAELLHHLDVEAGALLEALGLQELVVRAQKLQALGELHLDRLDGALERFARGHVVAARIDGEARDAREHFPGERIEVRQRFDLVVEELDAHRLALGLRRVDVDHVAAHPVGAAVQLHVVARVLQLREPPQDIALVHARAAGEVKHHGVIGAGIAEAVDGGDRRHDERVLALEQRLGGREAHLLDLLVDRRVLLDVGVGGRDVGLGLVVVVVGDEVLDRVAREELAHLAVELCGQGLVGRQDEGRALHPLDHVGDGVGLARARDSEQGLVREPGPEPLDELANGLALVTRRLVVGLDFERFAHARGQPRCASTHYIAAPRRTRPPRQGASEGGVAAGAVRGYGCRRGSAA